MTQALTLTEKNTFSMSPQDVVVMASEQSRVLMSIVDKTGCFQTISGKKYLQVEAWETIGAFNRTHAETDWVEPITKDNETIGYRAKVNLWKDGQKVGGSTMPCYFTENCCKGKEGDAKHKASMSAAQTFATSKAYRMNYSYIAILAGYQPLPAEEITDDMKVETVDKTKHWCEEHDTEFFMKGKMKSYAHPIKDAVGNTETWCHEHKEEPKKEVADADEPKELKNLGQFFMACNQRWGLTKSEVEAKIGKSGMGITDLRAEWENIKKIVEGGE